MQQPLDLIIDTNISIKFTDKRELISVYKSLKPDNIEYPSGLILDMQIQDLSLLLNLKFTSRVDKQVNINTLLNTVDELMEHITIIKNVIKND